MKRTMGFVLASFALLLVVLTLVGSGSTPSASAQSNPTPPPNLVAIWRKWMVDQNKGDVASVLAAFADDAVLVSGGSTFEGKAAIQKFYEGNASTHTQVDIVALTGGAENVLQTLNEVRDDAYTAMGLERIIVRGTITFTGNKVSRVVITPERSDPQTAALVKLAMRDPETIYRKLIDDLNKGDAASAAAAYTDDAVYIAIGTCPEANPCVGKAAIQKYYETFPSNHTRIDPLTVAVSSNTLTSVIDVRNDRIKAAGMDRIIFNMTLTYTGNKVSRLVHGVEASDPQTTTFLKTQPVQAQPDVVAVLRKLVDDVNKGDAGSVAAAYTDDAAVISFPNCPQPTSCVGKAAIQKYYEGNAANHMKLDMVAFLGGTGNAFKSLYEVRSDSAKAAGVDRIIINSTHTFVGNKIARAEMTWEPSDPQSMALYKARTDPVTIYRKMVDDQNKANIPSVLAVFTDDAVLIGSGCPEANPCVGKAALQKFYESNAASHARVDLLAVTVTGNTLQFVADARTDRTKAAGVERIINNATVTFTGAKISRLVLVGEPTDPQTQTFAKFLQTQPTPIPR